MTEEKEKKISRRAVVSGIAAGAVVGGVAGIASGALLAPRGATGPAGPVGPAGPAGASGAAASVLPTTWQYETDVLVVGANLGGLAASVRAVQNGANVVLIEASQKTGGTSLFSGGDVHQYNMSTWAEYQARMPTLDPVLGMLAADTWPTAAKWVQGLGVPFKYATVDGTATGASSLVAGQAYAGLDITMGPTTGSPTYADKRAYCDGFNDLITKGGGTILTSTSAVKLWQDPISGNIVGARADGPNGTVDIKAKATILSCGGFQNNKELRVRYFGRWADLNVARCVPYNTGAGLLMGVAVGAMLSRSMGKGYGHTQAYPIIVPQTPADYEAVTGEGIETLEHEMVTIQSQDAAGIYVNLDGNRFFDESYPDTNVLTYEFLTQDFARVFLIFDAANYPASTKGLIQEYIVANGGTVITADTVADLITALNTQFGVNAAHLTTTITNYNAAIAAGPAAALALEPPRAAALNSITQAPFYAIPATAGMSMIYGGLAIDTNANVLNTASQPIPGLYAIPGTAGGICYQGYIGGLGLMTTYGYLAGKTASDYAKTVT